MEWKANQSKACEYDIDWLNVFTKKYPGCLGYAVCLDMKQQISSLCHSSAGGTNTTGVDGHA